LPALCLFFQPKKKFGLHFFWAAEQHNAKRTKGKHAFLRAFEQKRSFF
tara:strand:+ start:620 stop:763 length:144 start_codon:yes stop_codon:yes gene_type:complete